MTPEESTQIKQGIQEHLAKPFDAGEVKFKPGAVSGNRAMAMAYITSRAVQDRLDEVVGVECWQDEYSPLPDGSMLCKLSVRILDEWVTKMDVGSPSEQPDEGDRVKAAVSDALKRAAVKFGIGRYLYRFPAQWCDWDAQKKRFVNKPALPGQKPSQPPAQASQPAAPPSPAKITEAQEKWQTWLGTFPGREEVNKRIPEVDELEPAQRPLVKQWIAAYGKKYHWPLNKEAKRFDEPAFVGGKVISQQGVPV